MPWLRLPPGRGPEPPHLVSCLAHSWVLSTLQVHRARALAHDLSPGSQCVAASEGSSRGAEVSPHPGHQVSPLLAGLGGAQTRRAGELQAGSSAGGPWPGLAPLTGRHSGCGASAKWQRSWALRRRPGGPGETGREGSGPRETGVCRDLRPGQRFPGGVGTSGALTVGSCTSVARLLRADGAGKQVPLS